eukprot:gene16710-22860_t
MILLFVAFQFGLIAWSLATDSLDRMFETNKSMGGISNRKGNAVESLANSRITSAPSISLRRNLVTESTFQPVWHNLTSSGFEHYLKLETEHVSHLQRCSNKYVNPSKGSSSFHEMVFSSLNRCSFYPRCLLFDCCSTALVNGVKHYLDQSHHDDQNHCNPAKVAFHCMFDSSRPCMYDMSLDLRVERMAIFQLVITADFVESMFMTLPTTPPSVFEKLSSRKEFKVLYLVQGDYRSNLPVEFQQMKDMLFLSYKASQKGDLFFPNSKFAIRRMALYIAGRLLELHQGWVYDYFVFLDDDPKFEHGNITDYELSLETWQPAIGSPAYFNYPQKSVNSLAHVDFIFKGYHREIIEVLFPWILEHDKNCTWASQLNQMQEATAVYRNHILAFKSLKILNPKHRPYTRDCVGPGKAFDLVVKGNWNSLPAVVKHCTIDKNEKIGPLFGGMGSLLGQVRPKVTSYHLMPNSIEDTSMSGINDLKPYGMIKQTLCENTNKWSPLLAHCCSVDFSILNSIANDSMVNLNISPDHEKVIALPSSSNNAFAPNDSRQYCFVWMSTNYSIPNLESCELMGFNISAIINY